jgi:hypothetical protein
MMKSEIILSVKRVWQKVDSNLFFFIIGISILKYFTFRSFDDTVALFSIDFMLANLLIGTFVPRRRKLALFLFNTIYFLLFIALTFSNFFHFSLRSLLDSLKFYQQVNLSQYVGTFILLGAALLMLGLLIRFVLGKNRRKPSIASIPFYVLFFALLYLFQKTLFTDYSKYTNLSHTDFKKTFYLFNKGDLTTMILADEKFAFGFSMKNKIEPLAGDKRSAFMKHSAPYKRSQLFIVVESLGKFTDGSFKTIFTDSISRWIEQSGYALVVDSVAFQGATIDGELRELFSVRGDYNLILNSDSSYYSLFKALRQNRFKTFSVSSSSGKVFSDRILYNKAGCEHSVFKEELLALPQFDKEKHTNNESAFSGVNDEFSFDYLLASIFSVKDIVKKAAYFLTINTHLPFTLDSKVKAASEFQAFQQKYKQEYDSEVIEHTYKLLQQMRYFIKGSLRQGIENVVLVGDHSPPFFDAAQRVHYSQTQVPVYVIRKM